MLSNLTAKQKRVLQIIYDYIESSGFPPTLADLKNELNLSSNQAILNYLTTLEEKGCLKREDGQARGIKILPLGLKSLEKEQLIPFLGASSAGPFIESLENIVSSWIPLMGEVVKNEKVMQSKEDFFAVQVYGDSMINAGINNEDILLVKKTIEFLSGDIVVARSDDGTTIKRFIAESDGRAYLKPENPAYPNIPIFAETFFDGKVILNLSAMNKNNAK